MLTKENGGINAWIMLSRVSQCHLHMDGLTVKGLATWLKKNIPSEFLDGSERTVKQLYPRLLDWCDELGLDRGHIKDRCNYQILVSVLGGLYLDQGIVATLDEIGEKWGEAYQQGRVVITRTMDAVRDRDPDIQMVRR